jgi:hypothetical protein
MDSYLYHAANFEPEVARFARAHAHKDGATVEVFKRKTLDILARILAAADISAAGREEWGAIRRLVETYEQCDTYTQSIVLKFGAPFSMRFALAR